MVDFIVVEQPQKQLIKIKKKRNFSKKKNYSTFRILILKKKNYVKIFLH